MTNKHVRKDRQNDHNMPLWGLFLQQWRREGLDRKCEDTLGNQSHVSKGWHQQDGRLRFPDFIHQKKHDLADWTYYIYIVYINMYGYSFTKDILMSSTHTHTGILFSLKEGNSAISDNTNLEDINHEWSWRLSEINQIQKKTNTVWLHLYVESKVVKLRGGE